MEMKDLEPVPGTWETLSKICFFFKKVASSAPSSHRLLKLRFFDSSEIVVEPKGEKPQENRSQACLGPLEVAWWIKVTPQVTLPLLLEHQTPLSSERSSSRGF